MSITSANSEFFLSIPDLGIINVPIQGYAADDAFAQEAVAIAETRMGVDGILSAGYTPNAKRLVVALQPDSDSIDIFDAWILGMEAAREVFVASATILIPGIGKAFAFSVGYLTNVKKVPDAKKVLEPQMFTIEWQDIQPTPI